MLKSVGSYSQRRGYVRRNRRTRRGLLLLGLAGALALLGAERARVATATAAPETPSQEIARVQSELNAVMGELDMALAQLDRVESILRFSTKYRISADLATAIHDVALAEGIAPDLAFRLVRVESEFRERATSPVGAIGLTQVMPSTARYVQPGITSEELYNRETNLRVGFRYLRGLIREYNGDVKLALLAYNRGPVTVNNARAQGIDPRNGYEKLVLKGYTGAVVVD